MKLITPNDNVAGMINLYCERLDPGFWAEPINAVSNFSFIIAAWATWKYAHHAGKLSLLIKLLIALMTSIGIASFLFHTYATNSTRFLDVFSILLFQLVFIWGYFRKIIQLRRTHSTVFLLAFLIFVLLARQFPQLLNGSLSYAPAIILLFALGVYHLIQKKREQFILLIAFAVFCLALLFRTIDSMICPYFPIGTHFLWHIINGVLVYLSVRALITNLPNEPQV